MTEPNEQFKEIQGRALRAKKYVEGWHTNIDKWRSLYNMDHYGSKAKPKEVRYSDPTYTNTVNLTVGIMLGNDIRWHSYGLSPSAKEQKSTGQIEKLVNGIIEANNYREESHQIYNLFLNFSRDGGGVIYSVFDPDLAKEFETSIAIPDLENSRTCASHPTRPVSCSSISFAVMHQESASRWGGTPCGQ